MTAVVIALLALWGAVGWALFVVVAVGSQDPGAEL